MTYQSVEVIAKAATKNQPGVLSALKYVPAGLAVLLFAVVVATLALLFPTGRSDAVSLTLAGMAPRNAWRKVTGVTFGSIVLGEVIGFIVATTVLTIFREPISRVFGQR